MFGVTGNISALAKEKIPELKESQKKHDSVLIANEGVYKGIFGNGIWLYKRPENEKTQPQFIVFSKVYEEDGVEYFICEIQ